MHTDQWRTDGNSTELVKSPLAVGGMRPQHTADALAQSARMGWMPFYPQFDRNPLDVADEAQAAVDRGEFPDVTSYVTAKLESGELHSAIEDVDASQNWPRTMILWRSNFFGSSAKGGEYFQKYLLGTHNNVLGLSLIHI